MRSAFPETGGSPRLIASAPAINGSVNPVRPEDHASVSRNQNGLPIGLTDAFVKLTFVLRAVEVAFRFCDESIVLDLPDFVAADSNALPGAAGAGVRSS